MVWCNWMKMKKKKSKMRDRSATSTHQSSMFHCLVDLSSQLINRHCLVTWYDLRQHNSSPVMFETTHTHTRTHAMVQMLLRSWRIERLSFIVQNVELTIMHMTHSMMHDPWSLILHWWWTNVRVLSINISTKKKMVVNDDSSTFAIDSIQFISMPNYVFQWYNLDRTFDLVNECERLHQSKPNGADTHTLLLFHARKCRHLMVWLIVVGGQWARQPWSFWCMMLPYVCERIPSTLNSFPPIIE